VKALRHCRGRDASRPRRRHPLGIWQLFLAKEGDTIAGSARREDLGRRRRAHGSHRRPHDPAGLEIIRN
jgi:hypothetical protein